MEGMPEPPSFQRLTFRIVLLKVSSLVARLVSVPDYLSLEELHEVLQLTFGWRCEPFYSFRIHGQEISRRRHMRFPGPLGLGDSPTGSGTGIK